MDGAARTKKNSKLQHNTKNKKKTHVLAVATVAERPLGAAARELAALAHDVHHAREGVLGAELAVLGGAVRVPGGLAVAVPERGGVAEGRTLEAPVLLAALGGDVYHALQGVGPAELDLHARHARTRV